MHDVLNPWANPVTYGVPFFLLAVVIEVLTLKRLTTGCITGRARATWTATSAAS
jgi:hypothetical protein